MNAYGVDAYGRPVGEPQGDSRTPSWWNQGQVNQWYRDLLGRPETNPDPGTGGNYGMEHMAAGSMDAVYNIIKNSPEAQAYAQSKQTGPKAEPQPQPQTPPTPAYPTYTPYQFTRRSLPTYTAPTLPTFTPPQMGEVENLQRSLVERILAAPETLSPEVMAMMEEKAKEQALALEKQGQAQLERDLVARGVMGGGYGRLATERLRDTTNQALMENRRNLLLEKAARDRADQLAAAALGGDFMNQALGREKTIFDTQQGTALAQAGLDQAALESMIRDVLFQNQQDLAEADEHRFAYGTKERAANFGEGQRQFNSNLGLNYAQLGATLQQALIDAILNSLR